MHDTQERGWLHLNFFQYQAYSHAKVPRVRCGAYGKTTQVAVPRSGAGIGFTLLPEALLVTLCRAMPMRQVAQLLAISDMRIWRTLDHYVDQARAQEDFSAVGAIGPDETAARRGHDYISLFHDLDAERLPFACEGRKAEVVAEFADDLEANGGYAENIQVVCIDMSGSYRAGVATHLPWSDVTFDEFHVIQLVNKAVDEVRRQEVATNPSLKHSRHLWLKHAQDWTPRQIKQYLDLKRPNIKTHRAFRIKEALREIFHGAADRDEAELLPNQWYSWARRCRIEPIKQVAKSIKNHWDGILNAFDSKLTKGRVEGANSQIRAAKAKARDYGTTRHLITISYFVVAKLAHLPASPFKLPVAATSLL